MNEKELKQNLIEDELLIIQGLQLLETKNLQNRTLVDIKRTVQPEDALLKEFYTITDFRIKKLIRSRQEIIKQQLD